MNDGTGTEHIEEIINFILFQKRLREDSNQMCNRIFPFPEMCGDEERIEWNVVFEVQALHD